MGDSLEDEIGILETTLDAEDESDSNVLNTDPEPKSKKRKLVDQSLANVTTPSGSKVRRKDFSSTKPQNSVVISQDHEKREQNLRNISSTLVSLKTDWPEFCENFNKWTGHRQRIIEALEDTAKDLDEIHLSFNAIRYPGNAASIVGASIELVGHFMEDSNTSRNLKQIGGIASGIGSVTSSGVFANDELRYHVKKGDVEAMLEVDRELMKLIEPWFQRAKSIDETLKEIFGIGLLTHFEERGKVIIFEIFKLFSSGKVVITDVMNSLIEMGYDTNKANFRSFTQITLNSLQDIFNDERLCPIFKSIPNIEENVLGVMQSSIKIILNPNMNLESSFKNLWKLLPISIGLVRFVQDALPQSVFVTVKIISLILESYKLIQKKPSEHAAILRDLKEKMTQEYERICVEFADYLDGNKYLPSSQIVE